MRILVILLKESAPKLKKSESDMILTEAKMSSSAITIGGVLGFIIVVLLVLLILCGIALMCMLRSDLKKNALLER